VTANNYEHRVGTTSVPVWKNQKGYACVSLTINGRRRAYLLHRLVWETANGPVPDGYDLHHLDHDRANWSIDNLKLVERNAHQQYHRDCRSTEKNKKAGTDVGKKTSPKHGPEN
jgi:hypothetical protein